MIIAVDDAIPYAHEAFGRAGQVLLFPGRSMTRRDLAGADALVVRSVTRVDRSLLEETPVRFVGTATIGTDHLDLDYLSSRGISVASAAGCNATAVTDYVFTALSVVAARKGWDLRKKSIGIVGAGNIGSRLARKTAAIGMEVKLCDPPLREITGDPKYGDLTDVLDADILTLHVPLTKGGKYATQHMFNRDIFKGLSSFQFLVNTSRGPVVSGPDLKQALVEKRLSGAVLDVWEGEPAIDPQLLSLVEIGTPHIAGYSLDGKIQATAMMADQLYSFFGLTCDWPLSGLFPPLRSLKPAHGTDGIDALRSVLLQAYNILEDDRALRAASTNSRPESAKSFERLRTEYDFRLEFSHYEVELPEHSGLETMFRALDFQIKTSAE